MNQPGPDEVLSDLGWDERWAAEAATYPDQVAGRVSRVDRGCSTVLTRHGALRVSVAGHLLENIAAEPAAGPCTGDWVMVREWPDDRLTLEAVLPRRTAVMRAEAGERKHAQALAANITVVAIVVGLDQLPTVTKIERAVSVAWDSGAAPMVLLTKADLVADAEHVAADVRTAAPGVQVEAVSVRTGEGLDAVRSAVGPRGTCALIGSSGAGKSTLVNTLVGAETLVTRDIRDDGRGRHTSVRRELVPLPGGGCLVDTPGLRGIGLLGTSEGLAATFSDIQALGELCRFSDCRHDGEPGCAVLAAVESGVLTVRRLESWRKLLREQEWMAVRHDARLRAERNKVWRSRTKSQRDSPKRR